VKVIYPVPDSLPIWKTFLRGRNGLKEEIQRKLTEILSRPESTCPSLVLAELGPVTMDDVTDWFHQNAIFSSEQRRLEAARDLFARRDRLRLSEIEGVLETIHRDFVREHMIERGSLP
jgi:hypothetical protein